MIKIDYRRKGAATISRSRELTVQEKRAIRKLVTTLCASYDHEYGCLSREAPCYMLGKCWTGSLCRYFRDVVLPNDPGLEAILNCQPVRPCKRCGKKFPVRGRQIYCSEPCAQAARREATAARVKRHRKGHGPDVTL